MSGSWWADHIFKKLGSSEIGCGQGPKYIFSIPHPAEILWHHFFTSRNIIFVAWRSLSLFKENKTEDTHHFAEQFYWEQYWDQFNGSLLVWLLAYLVF